MAPGADANVLDAQVLQVNEPSMSWKVPTGQSTHPCWLLAPRMGPKVPAGQFWGAESPAHREAARGGAGSVVDKSRGESSSVWWTVKVHSLRLACSFHAS